MDYQDPKPDCLLSRLCLRHLLLYIQPVLFASYFYTVLDKYVLMLLFLNNSVEIFRQ